MIRVKNAFFCTTPYQIIAAIVLNKTFGEKSDIYIVPQFKSAKACADNLRELGLFNRVKLVDTTGIEEHKLSKSRLRMHMGIVLQYFKVDAVAGSVLYEDTLYDKFYVSSKAYVPRMAHLYCVKHGIGTELVYYDDGEGSYYNRYRVEASPADKFVRWLLFGRRSVRGEHDLYLYDPELYRMLNQNRWKGSIFQIPNVINEQPFRDLIPAVFGMTPSDKIKERAIILDVLKKGKYKESDIELLLDIYRDVLNAFTKDDTIIKKHPRDRSEILPDFNYYEHYDIPFECLCTQSDINEKVLIAVSSTSVIIPKLLTDSEPVVILLYKLVDQINCNKDYREKQDRFYRLCQKRYSSTKRFYIPETYNELKVILESLAVSM